MYWGESPGHIQETHKVIENVIPGEILLVETYVVIHKKVKMTHKVEPQGKRMEP